MVTDGPFGRGHCLTAENSLVQVKLIPPACIVAILDLQKSCRLTCVNVVMTE